MTGADQSPAPSGGPRGGVRDALLDAALAELVEHGHAAIGLRAVARRAGVSHAAPHHHFGDRAGLLTAVAARGFRALADALGDTGGDGGLADLGHAYVRFGLAHAALFDLMFRPHELDGADAELRAAQREAIGALLAAVGADPDGEPTDEALTSWALVHGLVVLTATGALGGTLAPGADAVARAQAQVDVVAGLVGRAGRG